MLAYEPVWAIGSTTAASIPVIQEAHGFCRDILEKVLGPEVAAKIAILYGGSVTVQNAQILIEQAEVDGLLVGGASLTVETFGKIVNYNAANHP